MSRTTAMVLNEGESALKTRIQKNISSIYKTKDGDDVEIANDLILLGSFNPNAILKSVRLTTTNTIDMTVSLVLLNSKREEFKNSSGTISPLASSIALGSATLSNSEKLPAANKFKTLEEYIINATSEKIYRDQVFLALKVTTAPSTTITADLPILAEIDFIEKI